MPKDFRDLLCRTCLASLSQNPGRLKTFHLLYTEDLAKKLMLCSSLNVDSSDEYPQQVCSSCYNQIVQFNEFQQMCVPKLPSEITHLETSVKIGDGTLHYKYKDGKVSARLEGCPAELVVLPVSGQTDSPVFEGVGFCRPDPLDSYPCFETYHETALTY